MMILPMRSIFSHRQTLFDGLLASCEHAVIAPAEAKAKELDEKQKAALDEKQKAALVG
jgi:hypothetical protein